MSSTILYEEILISGGFSFAFLTTSKAKAWNVEILAGIFKFLFIHLLLNHHQIKLMLQME